MAEPMRNHEKIKIKRSTTSIDLEMGAGESVIRNVDKRTSRRENRDVFAGGIDAFREELERKASAAARCGAEDDTSQTVRVAIRKRPIFEHETGAKEFDVITCEPGGKSLVIHDARMGPDMKQRFIDHHRFQFHEVFSERDDSDKVFETVVAPLVGLVQRGGNATALMYGQTGSGKTFTATHFYKRASWELFRASPESEPVERAFVSFVELAGDTVHDVLNKHQKLQLLTCPNGDVLAYPGVQVEVVSPQQLLDCIKFACSLRTTAATGVHDQSSRSHAICRIEVPGGNALTLVDLAGSEHRIDSAEHDAQRRKESAQINSSLMKLKECVRAKAKRAKYVPYRQSKLTHLLRPAFVEDPGAESRTIIVATVSPSSKDTEHSLNTVRHACIMDGQDQDQKESRWVSGGETTRQELPGVDVTMLARKAKAKRDAIRKGITSGDAPGWSAPPSSGAQARDGSFDQVAKAREAKKQQTAMRRARNAAESRALQQLGEESHKRLLAARDGAGSLQRERVASQKHLEDEQRRAAVAKASSRPKLPSKWDDEPVKQQQQQQQQQQQPKPRKKPAVGSMEARRAEIREQVWNDPSIPDGEKEEAIVDRLRALKAGGRQQKRAPMGRVAAPAGPSRRAASVAAPAPALAVEPERTEGTAHDRHEMARLAREQMIAREQEAAAAKLRQKMERADSGSNNLVELQREVQRLQQELAQEKDTMKKYSIKQQLARSKASLIRLDRQAKQAEARRRQPAAAGEYAASSQ